MKILRVQGKNLASIAGAFELDFTIEPLYSAGIFVICGPTGSGKSTLLDAICLALFNNMPRTTGIEGARMPDVGQETIQQGDRRQILRRGTTEAMAAVEFLAVDGRTYRSVWRVWRANNRVNGRLQPAELRVYSLPDNTPITEGIGEAEQKLAQLTGLTYNQFTRTVLLAQNEFARFLKARREEKAEVLEKLTGTEIYSVISNTVYTRTAALRTEWKALNERMNQIQLLSPEETTELEKQLEKLIQQETQLQQKSQITSDKIKWYEELDQLTQIKEEAEQHLQVARKQQEEALPRAERISLLESVEDSRSLWHDKTETAILLSHQQQGLSHCENLLTETGTQAVQAARVLQEQEEILRHHSSAYEILKPELLEARKLDIDLTHARVNLEESRQAHSAASQAFREQEALCQQRREQATRLKEEIANLNRWFDKHRQHEQMCRNMGTIENFIDSAQQASLRADELRKQIADQENEAEKTTVQLNEQTARLEQCRQESGQLTHLCQQWRDRLKATDIRTLRQQLHQLRQRRELLIQAFACQESLLRYQQETGTLKKSRLEKEKTQEEYTRQHQELLPRLEACRIRKDTAFRSLDKARLALSANICQLRSQLEKNTPCPVCGSLQHPYATLSPADTVLQALQEEAETYAKEVQSLEAASVRLCSGLEHLRETLETLEADLRNRQKQCEEEYQKWNILASELGVPIHTTAAELRKLFVQVNTETETAEHSEKEWEKQNAGLREAEEQAAGLRQQTESLHTEIRKTTDSLAQIKNKISKDKGNLENLIHQQEEVFHKISGWISLPDWKERWRATMINSGWI